MVKDVPYEVLVRRALVDFDINSRVVVMGRALLRVTRWDEMGINGWRVLGLQANLKATSVVKIACQVEATRIRSCS
jgi:hypothetical protein